MTAALAPARVARLRQFAPVALAGGLAAASAVFLSPTTAVLVAVVPALLLAAIIVEQHVAPGDRRLFYARLVLWTAILVPNGLRFERAVAETQASLVSTANIEQAVITLACLSLVLFVFRISWRPANSAEWLLVAFVGWAMLSSVWSINPIASFLKGGELFLALLLVGLAVRTVPNNQDAALRHLVGAAAALALTVVVGAVVEPGVAFEPAGTAGAAAGINRLWGVLPGIHPDILGLLTIYGLLAVIAGVWPTWCAKRSARVALVCLFVAELVLSRSRSALGLLIVGLAVLAIADRALRLKLLAALVALLFVAVAVAPLSPVAGFLQRGQSSAETATLSGRLDNWEQALKESACCRLLGLGFYAGHRFNQVDLHYFDPQGLSNLDNTYVETIVDVGYIGLALLLLALGAGLRRIFKSAKTKTRPLRFAMFATGAAAAFINPSLQVPGFTMAWLAFIMMMPNSPTAHREPQRANHNHGAGHRLVTSQATP